MAKCALTGRECPRTNNPHGNTPWFCPFWTDGIIWRNTATGEEVVKHCAAEMLITGLIEVIKASNRPTAAIESLRNELVKGIVVLAGGPADARCIEHREGSEVTSDSNR